MAAQPVASVVEKTAMPLMRRTGSLLLRNTVVGILAVHPRNLLRPAQRREENAPEIANQRTRRQRVKSLVISVVLGVYVVFPVFMLFSFRVPEQMSWLQVFENNHYCLMGDRHACHLLLRKRVAFLGSFLATVALVFNLKKRNLVFFCIFLLGVVAFKVGVDELSLYRPPYGLSLADKVAVITGANRGIGLATARALADRGAHVVLTCRSLKKCEPVVDQINSQTTGSASSVVLNLSSLESAYNATLQLSQQYPAIHYVFCNAGSTPISNLTTEGLEDGFGGMHLAHVAFVLGLLPSLKRAGETSGSPSRIVMVSSEMAITAAVGVFGPHPLFPDDDNDKYNLRGEVTRGDGTLGNSLAAYGRAKLCNVLFALELNRRLVDKGWPVIAHAVHSGAVVTKSSSDSVKGVFRKIPGLSWLVARVYLPLLWRHTHGGARVLLCAALSNEMESISQGGQYLDALCHPFLPTHKEKIDPTLTEYEMITLNLWGDKSWTIYKDPIQALQLADAKWSARLWNVSLSLLQDSPAKSLVQLAP